MLRCCGVGEPESELEPEPESELRGHERLQPLGRRELLVGTQLESVAVAAEGTIGDLQAAACDVFDVCKEKMALWGGGELWEDGALTLRDCSHAGACEVFVLREGFFFDVDAHHAGLCGLMARNSALQFDQLAALTSGEEECLDLNLVGCDLGAEGAKHIADAIASGRALAFLTLHLDDNVFGAEAAKHIADAIASRRAPASLTLRLGENGLGAEGAKHIADAIASGRAPASLTLHSAYSIPA
jgi:hypothetical protein